MKITSKVRFGVAALAMGAVFAIGLPAKADPPGWVRAPHLNYFEVRGLVPPGSYSDNAKQKPLRTAHTHLSVRSGIPGSNVLAPEARRAIPLNV